MTTALDELRVLRGVLSDSRRWCQGSFFRLRDGAPDGMRRLHSPDVMSMCLFGATERFDLKLARHVLLALRIGGVAKFNDSHTHAEVLEFLDGLIKEHGG